MNAIEIVKRRCDANATYDVMAEHHRVLFSLISTGVQKRRSSWWIQNTMERESGWKDLPLYSHRRTYLQLRYWRSPLCLLATHILYVRPKKKIVSSTRISGTAQKEAVDIFFVWFICFNRDTSFFFVSGPVNFSHPALEKRKRKKTSCGSLSGRRDGQKSARTVREQSGTFETSRKAQ